MPNMHFPLLPFRRPRLTSAPLPVTMTGVRMGERVLQIGMDDPAIAGGIASTVGISGEAAFVVADDHAAVKVQRALAKAAALADVRVAPLDTLPFENEAFDAVIVHSASGTLASLTSEGRDRLLRECRRILRPGGRVVAIERGTQSGLSALVKPGPDPSYAAAGGTVAALDSAGFKPVRLLADREGYMFTEGLRP
jgi:ubiquinone/menaquinone biosynthesis C-methylase UbiE